MTEYYPPPAFRFSVAVAGPGTPLQLASRADGSFQEVSGLEAKVELENVAEGGENRFVHQLPKATRASNLVLRRGFVLAPSYLSSWVMETLGSNLSSPIMPQTLVVMLLGADGQPTVAWAVHGAWPVRWQTGPLDSMKNEVLVETLEFACNYIERVKVQDGHVLMEKRV